MHRSISLEPNKWEVVSVYHIWLDTQEAFQLNQKDEINLLTDQKKMRIP